MLRRLFSRGAEARGYVTVVSGLPRSGTSMMMKMLEAGGLPVLTDEIREADPDNPKGYYEFERVKKLPDADHGWLPEAEGKVVKVIAALLMHLPSDYEYRVLFMRRAMPEILASQRKMLVRRGEDPDRVSNADMAALFEKHVAQVEAWMISQPNLQTLDVDYNAILKNPQIWVERIVSFLGGNLDAEAMVGVVDPALYRQRHS